MNPKKLIAAASLCAISLSSLAEPTVKTNAFITAGISFTDSKVDYAGVGRNPSSSDVSKLGMQFSFDPDIEIPVTFTAQLLSKGRNQWEVEAEWAYLTYQATDEITIKAGKILAPFFMISQSIDVGITYPWSIPPEEIYGTANIPFSSVGGIDITYTGDIGDFEYAATIYNGENDFNVPAAGLTVSVQMQRATGFVFELTNDYGLLRYSIHDVEFTDEIGAVTMNLLPSSVDGKVLFSTLGAKFNYDNIVFMTEFARRDISNSVFPDSDAWYVTIGYRFGNYLPTLTYSDVETSNSVLDQTQDSIILGLEVTTSSSTRLNFEIIRISLPPGSAGVFDTFPVAFGGAPVHDTTKAIASFSMVF